MKKLREIVENKSIRDSSKYNQDDTYAMKVALKAIAKGWSANTVQKLYDRKNAAKNNVKKELDEAKKVKLTPGEKISSREFARRKKEAKSSPPKKTGKKKVVIKSKKPVKKPEDDSKHPLEDILKNENKGVRARLLMVPTPKRLDAQKYIQQNGMGEFMKNADKLFGSK